MEDQILGGKDLNILIQQSDLVIVFGSRLGLQQQVSTIKFVPVGKICQIEIDQNDSLKVILI